MYDENGKQIAHRTGQFRLELVFDHAGTPTDVSDDQLVSLRFVRFVTRGDDFCTSLVHAIG